MNYVRFKKRILLTWTYNFLLIKADIVQNGLVSAIMRLMERALLSDYDLLSLSDLDNLTLFEIDYIDE
jgi:hypothetical protein